MRRLYVIYFSPSGSTEKVVKEIASEFPGMTVETINLLTSASRKKSYTFGHDDIVIFGMMTAGKLFTLSDEIFSCLHADGTPFVGVVTFGNGYYGIALNEMLSRAKAQGFKAAALGAFVSRHSEEYPDEAYALPASCKAKEITDACIKCGTCVRNCPVDAIDIEAKTFDVEKCIGCWGCINRCPKHAIKSTSKEVAEIMRSFGEASTKRLEPEIFM